MVGAFLLLRPYLERFKLTVQSDHEALEFILILQGSTHELGYCHLRVSEFEFNFVQCAGIKHQAADDLTQNSYGKKLDADQWQETGTGHQCLHLFQNWRGEGHVCGTLRRFKRQRCQATCSICFFDVKETQAGYSPDHQASFYATLAERHHLSPGLIYGQINATDLQLRQLVSSLFCTNWCCSRERHSYSFPHFLFVICPAQGWRDPRERHMYDSMLREYYWQRMKNTFITQWGIVTKSPARIQLMNDYDPYSCFQEVAHWNLSQWTSLDRSNRRWAPANL